MMESNATFRKTEETEQTERAAHKRGWTIAKYVFLTGLRFCFIPRRVHSRPCRTRLQGDGRRSAFASLPPLLWYTVETMIKDAKQIHKIIKEEKKFETSL